MTACVPPQEWPITPVLGRGIRRSRNSHVFRMNEHHERNALALDEGRCIVRRPVKTREIHPHRRARVVLESMEHRRKDARRPVDRAIGLRISPRAAPHSSTETRGKAKPQEIPPRQHHGPPRLPRCLSASPCAPPNVVQCKPSTTWWRAYSSCEDCQSRSAPMVDYPKVQ